MEILLIQNNFIADKNNAMKKIRKVANHNAEPRLLSSLLLLAYGFITWVTPNMHTFDSNGPKFLAFGVLNLVVFCILFWYVRKEKGLDFLFQFFDTKVGFAYGILMIFTLLSFFKAININESILHFSKVFTTFVGAWFIGALVSKDKKSLVPVAVGLSILLILDSFQTFSGIMKLIKGDISHINFIKASYSNKNILTSAIFIKLPFALWLFYFQKSWIKYLGVVSLFSGVLATFFMSSRAFYLGLFLLSILLIVYAFIKVKKTKERGHYKYLTVYLVIVFLSFGIFSFVQNTMYPKNVSTFKSRVESITSTENGSNRLRLKSWKYTATQMIPNDPLLGVGVGNWKLRYLEYENSYSPSYTYMYKNHNDFLEIAAESGIFAGIAFICLFVFIFWSFVRALLKGEKEQEKYFFLSAFGIVAYFFDAFFNFPQDRPEIQSWFALYVGIAAGLSVLFYRGDSGLRELNFKGRKYIQIGLTVFAAFILVESVYVLTLNKKSLVWQRKVKEEMKEDKLKTSSEVIIGSFPAIPDITILAEPIAVQKARYLIKEEKFSEAREILYKDHSNPYDARKEYFIAMSFYKEKQYDSAMYYAQQALELKPYFYGTNTILASVYEKRGDLDSSINLWRKYLKGVKNKTEAWTIPVSLLIHQGKIEESESLIDSAYYYKPNDKKILALRSEIKSKVKMTPYKDIYQKAADFYAKQDYTKALEVFSEFIEKVPDSAKAYGLRAVCYYRLGKFTEAIKDIDEQEKIGGVLPSNMFNIRGASYYAIGDNDKAKEDFKKGMEMGDEDAKDNYNRFFKKEEKSISFEIPVKK